MIKVVTQAIPTYAMFVFMITPTLCDKLEKKMNMFWWSHNWEQTRMIWSKCGELCGKVEDGGLGFRKNGGF